MSGGFGSRSRHRWPLCATLPQMRCSGCEATHVLHVLCLATVAPQTLMRGKIPTGGYRRSLEPNWAYRHIFSIYN
jgi:hypothetical protein